MDYGYPYNWHFFEYVKVASINPGSGVVCFDAPLKNTYESTWPRYGVSGGPAALWVLDPSWDIEVEYRGLTISQNDYQIYADGRSVTYRDVTFTGSECTLPTQNMLWQAINTDMGGCWMEADKLVTSMVMDHVQINGISFQSSSIDLLKMDNSTVTTRMDGTPKKAVIYSTRAMLTFCASPRTNCEGRYSTQMPAWSPA